jgi:hypothetical protein
MDEYAWMLPIVIFIAAIWLLGFIMGITAGVRDDKK